MRCVVLCLSCIFIAVAVVSATSFAKTWFVHPDGIGDVTTIQAGIDSACAGDTVLLAPRGFSGPRNRNIDFKGKAITVTSEFGPYTSQVLLPSDDSVGFIFQSGEGPASRLESVGIVGGGHFDEASYLFATGIKCVSSSPTITGNHIVSMNHGVAIKCEYSNATISGNIIERMIDGRKGWGEAIHCLGGSPVIVDNIVRENGHPPVGSIESWIRGIVCSGGTPTIQGNEIVDNVMLAVAAISVSDCSAQVSHNLIARNMGGYGISTGGSTPSTISNNTVVGNWTNVSCSDASIVTANIIAYGDHAVDCYGAGMPTFSCNVIFGNTDGDTICGIDGGGNIFQDPLFCGPTAPGGYTLHVDSPCLPENNACGQLIGSLPLGCGIEIALDCPSDMFIPGFSTIPSLSLDGFRITNLDTADCAFDYYLTAEGPATLVDKGDPCSISGSTPILAPGTSYYPPEAGLEIPAIRAYAQELVTYRVSTIGSSYVLDSCTTVITMEPPVAVQIGSFRGRVHESGVELVWDVVSDEEIKGFNVYRSEERGPANILLNSSRLIPDDARRYIDSDVRGGNIYNYLLCVVRKDGSEVQSQEISVRMTARAPALALHQNYPNPFNPSTTISFTLPRRSVSRLAIYDIDGKLVKTLADGPLDEGSKEITWDGKDARGNSVSSGVYFYRLTAGNRTLTKKMVLLK